MRCSKFRKAVLPLMMEAAGKEELALSLARIDPKLRDHLDSCGKCARYLRSSREALGRLGTLAVEMPGEREWEEMRRAIHESVREDAPAYRVVWPRLAPASWARVAAVAAVALVIVLSIQVYYRPRSFEAPLPQDVRVVGETSGVQLDMAFLDEMEVAEGEYDNLLSEIDSLMREIDSAYAQLDRSTGEISLKERPFDNILT